MGLRLAPTVVADIEWAVVSLTGLIAVISLLGALYSVPWTFRSRQQATTRAFNYLWITRALLQVLAACYALSLDLRLQVLWSANSAIIPGGYNVDAMCRLYIGLSHGLLEPSFLLLVLFACLYTVHKHTSEPGSNPNLFIFALTVGLTLPMCAAQVFAALFSRIMTQLKYNEELMYKFFAASASVGDAMCPAEPENPNCAVCLFPEFSTLISATFALMYLLVLWAVLGRIASTAINKMLARRIRLLQICITLFFCASITLRGVTVVNIDPYSLDFVALWLANVVVGSGLILVVSAILVWVPVYDGRLANARIGPLVAESSFLNAPTELLPLVGYGKTPYSHDAASSDYDYGGSQTGDQLLGGLSDQHHPQLQQQQLGSSSSYNQLQHQLDGSCIQRSASASSVMMMRNPLVNVYGASGTATPVGGVIAGNTPSYDDVGYRSESRLVSPNSRDATGTSQVPESEVAVAAVAGGVASVAPASTSSSSSSPPAGHGASPRLQQRRRNTQQRAATPAGEYGTEYNSDS